MNGRQTPAPQQGLDGLQGLRLTGSSSSISQSSTYEIANGFLAVAIDTGDPLSIGANWTQAEFNIFGYGGGSGITFNQYTSIVVRVEGYGGDATPQCVTGGFTAEYNNLNWISPCAQYNGGVLGPGIQFTEDFFPQIPGCPYTNPVATCVAIPGSTFTDAAFTASCPVGGSTTRWMNGGAWQALPLHCSDGSLPGHCNPAATVANQPVLSTQRYGVAMSGAPVGSSQTYQACDNASNCTRLALNVPNCPSPVSPGDSFKLSDGNNPIEVMAGGAIDANLVMDGPWVSWDHGADATGSTFAGAGLPPGMIVTLSPGVSGAPYLWVDGRKRRCAAQRATRRLQFPSESDRSRLQRNVQPHRAGENSRVQANQNLFDDRSTHVWSCFERMWRHGRLRRLRDWRVLHGFCCPEGSFFNTSINSCQPNSCPAGKVYCPALGDCETNQACDAANKPVCRKILGKLAANNARNWPDDAMG